MVRAPTPDVVLTGVELLADAAAGDVVVVDVGGATTDVYSRGQLDPEDAGLSREVVAHRRAVTRTVEGDLGMRWSAAGGDRGCRRRGTARSGRGRGARRVRRRGLGRPRAAPGRARGRRARPAPRPARPHRGAAPPRPPADTGVGPAAAARRPARRRHRRRAAPRGAAGRRRILAPALTDHAGGWRVPESARATVDGRYVLFAAGLLAAEHPAAARALVRGATMTP